MISKILIAVEDAHFMDVTEEFISQLQAGENVVLKALHVIEPREAIAAWPSQEYQQEAEALIDSTCHRLSKRFPHVKVKGCVKEGPAMEVIVEEASDWGADLILMGPYGKQGIGKFLLGSVARSVIPISPCSVVLLHAHHTEHKISSTPSLAQPKRKT